MGGNDFWSDYARIFEKKQLETADYKKLLSILAVSVIVVTLMVQAALFVFAAMLPVFLESGNIATDRRDFAYFFMWLANDIIVYTPPLLVFGFIFRSRLKRPEPVVNYVFKNSWVLPFFLAGIAIATGSSIFTSIIADLISGGEDVLQDVFRDVLPRNDAQLLIMLFTVGIITPICEETIYRHILLKPLRRYGDLQAVIITSILFGFFHGNLTQFLYATMVGFILGVAAVKANSVIPAIFIHTLNNVFVVFNSHLAMLSESGETAISEAALGALNIAVLAMGVAALAIMAAKNILTIQNYNPYISPGERVQILMRRPSVITMAVLLIIFTILGSLV